MSASPPSTDIEDPPPDLQDDRKSQDFNPGHQGKGSLCLGLRGFGLREHRTTGRAVQVGGNASCREGRSSFGVGIRVSMTSGLGLRV